MRIAILTTALGLLLAGPALALRPEPVHPDGAAKDVRQAPLSRSDRWRGTPYTRSETDQILRESLDKNLTRDADLAILPTTVAPITLSQEDDLLRREALDKLIPVPVDGAGSGGFVPGLPSF